MPLVFLQDVLDLELVLLSVQNLRFHSVNKAISVIAPMAVASFHDFGINEVVGRTL